MLIKMKESKGFTLVELMIVVAIIGILAAVAVPFYQRYIQKSRMSSLVYPGLHSIQTNIGTYYSFQQDMPSDAAIMSEDADTTCFNVGLTDGAITTTIDNTNCEPLTALDGLVMTATPITSAGKVRSWNLSGNLATTLGLEGEGAL